MTDPVWGHLNPLQLGRYAEYFVKMEFTRAGLDVYSAEVDDKGIDFVARKGVESYYDVQVKSVRRSGYVFTRKDTFETRPGLLLALVVFVEGVMPRLYLIPAMRWLEPDALLRDRPYGGDRKSAPEWGVNISSRNQPLLDEFAFDRVVASL